MQAADDAGAVFSGSHRRGKVKAQKLRFFSRNAWVLFALAMLAALILYACQSKDVLKWPRMPGRHQHDHLTGAARLDILRILSALIAYHDEFGAMPNGDNAAIVRTLTSDDTSRKSAFIDMPKSRDAEGRFLDPWGSFYRIDLSDPGKPKVWSPGKNKKDEPNDPHSDDICSWR